MKTVLAVILLLAAAAAIGLGVVSAPASAQPGRAVPPLVMRSLPGGTPTKVASAVPAIVPHAKKDEDELEALKPAAKPGEAKPAEAKLVAAKPSDAKPAAKPAETKPAEKPPEAKVAETKPAVVRAPPAVAPKPVAGDAKPAAEPKPVAARPPRAAPAPAAEAATPATGGAAAPPAQGTLTLRATDTADVFVDGKKVGGSPILGLKVKPGKHKIRFDCYDATGEALPGTTQTLEVAADGEADLEYDCPGQ